MRKTVVLLNLQAGCLKVFDTKWTLTIGGSYYQIMKMVCRNLHTIVFCVRQTYDIILVGAATAD